MLQLFAHRKSLLSNGSVICVLFAAMSSFASATATGNVMNVRLARRLGLLAVSALLMAGPRSEPALAAEPDLQAGDLFVGAISERDGWREAGVIKRVRGGSVSTYCESTFDAGPDLWRTPHDVLVDSQGRIVFLSELGGYDYTRRIYVLLRCSGAGSSAEKLAIFGADANDSRGYPVPFPDLTIVGNVGGLHLARKTSVVIDDDIAGGKPKTGKEDIYGLVISIPSEFKSVQYRPATGEWEKGAQIVPFSTFGFPDATYYGGATYSALENVLGRDREPFRFEMSGNIEGVSFGLKLGIFGGYNEVGGGLSQGSFEDVARTSFVLDDIRAPNVDGGCPPGTISTAVPRGSSYGVPAGFGEVAKHNDFGLVVTSNSTATGAGPFLTQFGGVLLDDNPFNDGQALFLRPELACNAQRKLDFEPILPWWDPTATTATSNGVNRLVSGTEGLFGTQAFAGTVVQIRPGDRLSTIASGLIRPTGIAAYPANVPPGFNIAIVIRIDSPVNVLVTDSNGKRIGVDASGNVVNDFGPFGYVGDPGEPRLIAIREPTSGDFSVDTLGTGTGPYAVHAYSINTDEPLGEHIVARGTAAPGSTADHDFTLAVDGTLSFSNALPVANAGPDQVVQASSSSVASVALDASASSDPDGDALSFNWSGPFGLLTGARITPTLPIGIHSLTLTVNDGKGGISSDTVEITVNAPANTAQAHSNGSSSYFSEGGYNAYATFNVKLESGASTPSGPLTFSSSKTRRKIASTGITSLSATGKTAMITGPCTLNGVAGYSFTAAVGDNATPGTGADTFAIAVTGPNGFTYTASGTIKSGDYTVSQ